MKQLKNTEKWGQPSRLAGWLLVPLLMLVIWQIAGQHMNKPWLLPTPMRVAEQLCHPTRIHFNSGSLLSNSLISLLRVLLGFSAAAVIGILSGLLLGSFKTLRSLIEPTLEMIRPLCPVVWLPFAIAVFKLKTLPNLFGIRYSHTIFDQVQLGMLFVIFIGGFFPIFTNTLDGVLTVRQNFILLARTLGASKGQIFYKIALPAALPQIVTGLRQGLGMSWFVIMAAEMMVGVQSGIGYLLMYAADNAAMDLVISCMLIIGGVGAAMMFLMRQSLIHHINWKGREF
ncbi:MAG: ABC transporter permease [Sedimentisphaerales bacterium]|nr:ABC transporter permease [Sedimentisphaerales bacterium]